MDLALVVWVVGVCVFGGEQDMFWIVHTHARHTAEMSIENWLVGWLVADCSGKPETHA